MQNSSKVFQRGYPRTLARSVSRERFAVAITNATRPEHQAKFLSRSQRTAIALRAMVGK